MSSTILPVVLKYANHSIRKENGFFIMLKFETKMKRQQVKRCQQIRNKTNRIRTTKNELRGHFKNKFELSKFEIKIIEKDEKRKRVSNSSSIYLFK